MKTRKIKKKVKKVVDDEQKYICDDCKQKIVLGKNVHMTEGKLSCKHALIMRLD